MKGEALIEPISVMHMHGVVEIDAGQNGKHIGLQAGDQQTITLRGPDGAVISEYAAQPLDRDKAQYFVASGKRLKAARWSPGLYKATYRVTKGDQEVLSKTFEVDLGPR